MSRKMTKTTFSNSLSRQAAPVPSAASNRDEPTEIPPPPPSAKQATTSPRNNNNMKYSSKRHVIDTNVPDAELVRKYDLAPLGTRKDSGNSRTASYSVDPWEVAAAKEIAQVEKEQEAAMETIDGELDDYTDNGEPEEYEGEPKEEEEDFGPVEYEPTFLMPGDIHPNMEHNHDEISQLRLLAGKLSADWRSPDFMAPALARRIRDFQFAQEKRRKKYGDERPWGILGVYDHLSSIRVDVEWAEDAAWRRVNGESYRSWADFDESKKGKANRPYFTYVLLVACTLVMIASIAVNGWEVEPLDENPMIGPSAQTLIKMGAKDTDLIINENEGWRLLTSTLLHAGLVHYAVNMAALWFVGAAIEMSYGWVAAMIIFVISAVGGAIMSAIFLSEYITVGASGGIFGFIGACLADIIMNWKLLFCDFVTENGKKHWHAMVVIFLLLDIGLNCIIGVTPFVDNFTHLGGMAYGFLCGISTMGRLSTDFFGLEEDVLQRTKHFVVRFFGLIVSFASIVATLIILLQSDGTTDVCPNCTWLSCIPFPPWEDDTSKWWYCDDCGSVTADIVAQPNLRLDLYCPSGATAEIDLEGETNLDRDILEKRLPKYCREFCPLAEERN